MAGKMVFFDLGNGVRGYVNLAKGKIGAIHSDGKNVVHAGFNTDSGRFVRAQKKVSNKVTAYAYAKAHNAGAGVAGRIAKGVSGKIAIDKLGPYIEGKVRSVRVRSRLR